MRRVYLFIGVLLSLSLLGSARIATADSAVTCDSLTVSLSDDKNYYIFSAASSGDGNKITGYTFDYGDHESYRFQFAKAATDRSSATVRHTYQNPGVYTATVSVSVQDGSKKSSVSSPDCHTTVTILPPGSELPNTGVRLGAVLYAAGTGAVLHQLWLRGRLALTKAKRRC